MKRLTAILLLVLTAGMLVGCAASAKDEPAVTKPPFDHDKTYTPRDPATLQDHRIDANIAKEILYWDSFHLNGDVDSGFFTRVFTDYEDFEKELAPESRGLSERYSRESFDNTVVVAVYLVANSGGWSYEVTAASIRDGALSVNIKGTAPNGMATQALERHVVLVAVDRASYTEGFGVNVTLNGKVMGSGKII